MVVSNLMASNRDWPKTMVKMIQFERSSWYYDVFYSLYLVVPAKFFRSVFDYCRAIRVRYLFRT